MPHLKGPNGEDICACSYADAVTHHAEAMSAADEQCRRIEARARTFERRVAAGVPLRHLVPRTPGFLGWIRERWTDVVQVWRDGELS